MTYRALSFDCYGTLIDWEAGIWAALQPLLSGSTHVVGRSEALALFAELESAEQAAHPGAPYPRVLRAVHRAIAARLDRATTADLDDAFGRSVPRWPAFDDSTEALGRLGERYRLIILSNVDRAGFAASAARLSVSFDAVYTAEDIGSYKPDPANFDYLIDHARIDLRVEPAELLHVAQSVFHDLVPAARAGLDMAWVDRQGLADGGAWGATARVAEIPPANHVVSTLGQLADQLCE